MFIIYFLNYYLRKKTRTFYNESQGLLFIMFIRPPLKCFIYFSKINLPPQKIINWYSNYAGFMPLSINLKKYCLEYPAPHVHYSVLEIFILVSYSVFFVCLFVPHPPPHRESRKAQESGACCGCV